MDPGNGITIKMLEKLDLGQALLREEQQKQCQLLISIWDTIKPIHQPEDKVLVTESASLETKSPMPPQSRGPGRGDPGSVPRVPGLPPVSLAGVTDSQDAVVR